MACALGSESKESWPLDHQEIPTFACRFGQLCDAGVALPLCRGEQTETRGEVTCPRPLSEWRGGTRTPSAWVCHASLLLPYERHTHTHALPHTHAHITLTHTHTHIHCPSHRHTHRFMTVFSKWLVWNFFTKHQMLKESSLSPIGPCLKSWLWKWRKVNWLSHVWLFATPWTVAYQAPPSMGFSRQEYWSGLPLPSPQWLFRQT